MMSRKVLLFHDTVIVVAAMVFPPGSLEYFITAPT